jgi:AcrR family transcriptional regulator
MNKSTRRGRAGRRPGRPGTREAILAVARRRFMAEGYEAVTMRSIAAEAGVDAALISYFFGSKQGLLGASLALAASPADVLSTVLPGDLEGLPERVLRALLATWDDPQRGNPLRVMLGAAARDAGVARLVREMAEREIIGRIAERLGGADATQRAAVFTAQLTGVIFGRYLIGVDPIATMPVDELVARLTPGLRAVLRPRVWPPAPRPVG